ALFPRRGAPTGPFCTKGTHLRAPTGLFCTKGTLPRGGIMKPPLGLFALRRYLPYLRPYTGLVIVFGLAQLGSLAASAAIPKVIEYIIDGPISHHQSLAGLLPMTGLLVAIGLIEFAFIFMRRNYSGIASLRMETDLRNDFYAHLQGLQVSFHDNCQSA